MANTTDVKSLTDLLIKDRDYHSAHPRDAYYKFIYSLGGTLAAVIGAIYLSVKFTKPNFHGSIAGILVINILIMLYLLGLILILLGFKEHACLHKQQRQKIEAALNDIFASRENFNYE